MKNIPKNWLLLKIGDKRVSIDIKPGFACGKKDTEGGVPHLRMNNISSEGLPDFSLIRRIPKKIANEQRRWLEPGDILFCNTNSTELVGKSCLFKGWQEPCTFSNHLTRIRANTKYVLPEWLALSFYNLWLSGYFGINCIEFIGQSAFNKNKLLAVEIPIPPLEEQQRIVSRIEALTKRVEEARKMVKDVEAELANFTPALLAKAFGGEL